MAMFLKTVRHTIGSRQTVSRTAAENQGVERLRIALRVKKRHFA